MKESKFFLTHREAKQILSEKASGGKKVELSLDLGKTKTSVELGERKAKKLGCVVEYRLVEKIARDEKNVYFFDEHGVKKAAFFSKNKTYRLQPTVSAPALVVNGFLMHRVKDTDPLKDAEGKAAYCKKNQSVLDVCTGLGYSAIACAEKQARVTSIEYDENVLELAKLNPYSQKLFQDPFIRLVVGDASKVLPLLETESFDLVLHDPPTLALGGKLYSKEFYAEVFGVLKRGGRLFHYTGSPGEKYRGKDVARGVMERLREKGFVEVKRDEKNFGVSAQKPKKGAEK